MNWNKVYPSLSQFLTPLSAPCLAHCSTSYVSFLPSHLQLHNYVTYSADYAEEMHNNNLGGFMPLIHVLWYLNKFLVDCRNNDVVVVVDETPPMAVKIAMSDGSIKVAFLAMSPIRQKDLSSASTGALQHAIVMRHMLDNDHPQDGVAGAHWYTQEHSLLRGIPLWVWDSDPGHQGHHKVHAAEAAQKQVVFEAPVDDSGSTTTTSAPTLPKMKKNAQVEPTRGTRAEKGTPSSSKKQAKEKGKESDKVEETDDEDADEEGEEEDLDQVLETHKKRKRTPTSDFDASPDDGLRFEV